MKNDYNNKREKCKFYDGSRHSGIPISGENGLTAALLINPNDATEILFNNNITRVINGSETDLEFLINPSNDDKWYKIIIKAKDSNSNWIFRRLKIADSTGYNSEDTHFQYER